MSRSNKNQVLLLVVLLASWAAVLLWQFAHPTEQERVPLKNVSGAVTSAKAAPAPSSGGGLHVNLERLTEITGQRSATFSTPRNIFASLSPPVAPPPVVAAGSSSRRPRAPRAAPAPVEPAAEEAQPPEEPEEVSKEKLDRLRVTAELNQFRYLGFMKVGDNRQGQNATAVLVKNEEMHLVHSGETIAKQVLVKSISPTEITLQDLTTKIVQVIPVIEEVPPPAPAN